MRNKALVLTALAILLIGGGAFALISNADKEDNTSTSSPATSTPSASTQSQSSNGTSVTIQDMAFTPVKLTVKKGTTVTWKNNDSVAHTVTSGVEHGPNSSTVNPGETYSFTLTDDGVFDYRCTIHPNMQASVTVID